MKKALSLFLVFVMCLPLCACSKDTSDNSFNGTGINATNPSTNTTDKTTDFHEDATVPSTTEPSTTEPSTTEPSTTEPSTTEPSTTEPSTTEPSTTEPSTTEPTTTEPSTTEPPTTEPAADTHNHEWKYATCTVPKTCKACGITEGTAKGHNWEDATCTAPITCKICGTTEGTANGHNWKSATCIEPKICETCSTTSGTALDHNYNQGTCQRCGSADPNREVIEITLENWSQYFEVSYNHEEWTQNVWGEYAQYEHYCEFELKDEYSSYEYSVVYEADVGYTSHDFWIDFNNKEIQIGDYHADNNTIFYKRTTSITRAMSGYGGIIKLDDVCGKDGVGTNYQDSALPIVCDVQMVRIKGVLWGRK